MFNLPDSMLRGAGLDVVSEQVAAASGTNRHIYVERRGDVYRWSLTSSGGPYPLMRKTAKLLGINYLTIILPYRTLDTGLTIIEPEPEHPTSPDSWTMLEFDSATSTEAVRARVRDALASARDLTA